MSIAALEAISIHSSKISALNYLMSLTLVLRVLLQSHVILISMLTDQLDAQLLCSEKEDLESINFMSTLLGTEAFTPLLAFLEADLGL